MKTPSSHVYARLGVAALLLTIFSYCKSQKQMDALFLPGEALSKPVVLSTSPADQSIGISPNGQISVLFSTAMDEQKTQDAFRLSSSTARVDGSFSWEWYRLVFHPRSPLTGGEYTLTIGSAAESAKGVDLGKDHVIRFYVGSDIEKPRFVSSTPASGALAVAPSSTIRLSFSEPVSYASLSDGLQVSPSFAYTISMENGGADVVLLPSNPLPYGTIRIAMNARLTDMAGNGLYNETTFVFTVGSDFIAPGITDIQSGSKSLTENLTASGISKSDPVVINFSEPMDRVSVEEAISLSPSPSLGYTWLSATQLQLTPIPSLEPETDYTLRISSTAKDLQGNYLQNTLTYPFRTDNPDSVRPKLIEVRQFSSSSPAIPCTDNAGRGMPLGALSPLSPIDTSMWIDTNDVAGARSCVLQFRFLFNNEMVRSSLVDAFSPDVVLHPTGDMISLYVHDLQLDPSDARVMVLHIGGTFPPKGLDETPIIRFTITTEAKDVNGNSMAEDVSIYLSY